METLELPPASAPDKKKDREHELRWKISSQLDAKRIPHVTEARCYDPDGYMGHYISVDIMVLINRPMETLLFPFMAVELKNSNSRDEAMRGAGQCLTYLSSGFNKAMLVTPFEGLSTFDDGLKRAGIIKTEPEYAADYIEELFKAAGGLPCADRYRYRRPAPRPPCDIFGIIFGDMIELENRNTSFDPAI